jgi:hypothetical protein
VPSSSSSLPPAGNTGAPDPAPGEASFLRLVAVASFHLSAISTLASLGFGRDAFHSAAIALGFTVCVLAHLGLRRAQTPAARTVLRVALIVGLACGAWAAAQAKDTDAGSKVPAPTAQPQPLRGWATSGSLSAAAGWSVGSSRRARHEGTDGYVPSTVWNWLGVTGSRPSSQGSA